MGISRKVVRQVRNLLRPQRPLRSAALVAMAQDMAAASVVAVCTHGLADGVEIVELLSRAGFTIKVIALYELSLSQHARLANWGQTIDLAQPQPPAASSSLFPPATRAWRQFKRHQATYTGAYPQFFANPALDFHFGHYFIRRWPQIAGFIEQAAAQLSRLELDCLVTSNLTDTENWALVELLRQRAIPIVLGLHSGWPDPEGLFASADKVMVWSETHRRQLLGRVGADIIVTGRLDNQSPPGSPPSGDSGVLDALEIPPGQSIVLLLTTNMHTGLFPVLDIKAHEATIRQLFRVPADLQGRLHVIVKTKPNADHFAAYAHGRETSGHEADVTVVSDLSLKDLVCVCTVAVLVNVPTTAYWEAINQDKPVVFVSTTAVEYCGQPRVPEGSLPVITRDQDIWPVLRRLVTDVAARDQLLSEQRTWHALDRPTEAVGDKIVDVVRSTLDVAH